MSEAATHLRELAERIGPRPATTDTEAEAADYIQGCFESRGLEVERQEFMAPRTYAWAYVAYHALTIGAAVLAGFFAWPAFVVALLTAILMTLDLDTRFGLSNLMPKGPTQNIIARKPAASRRGEVTRRVVVVAHYDTARSSLAFSPGMVKNFNVTFGLMKVCTWLVPAFALVVALNLAFLADVSTYVWYATMAASAYLVVPLLINVHRELAMDFVDGANDNASGVAAMLGLLERACPEEVVTSDTRAMRAVAERVADDWAPTDLVAGIAANAETWATSDVAQDTAPHDPVAPADDVMRPTPAGPLDDGFADAFAATDDGVLDDEETWDSPEHIDGQRELEVGDDLGAPPAFAAPATGSVAPRRERARGPIDSFADDIEFVDERVAEDEPPPARAVPAATAPAPAASETATPAEVVIEDPDVVEADETDDHLRGRGGGGKRGGWFRRRKKEAEEADWVGFGSDVVEEGRRIGSWDQFDDEDERGSKGGTASWSELEDPDFATSEAARIRSRVTQNMERGLAEKEIWFVATGAEETGTWGMRAFLDEYGSELRKASIINFDNVGSGALAWVTREGMAKRYTSDRRMMSAARRVARERQLRIKGVPYDGLSTDATPALARGLRAMSIMAFDINGRLPNWHWKTDTVENVSVGNIDQATDFVSAIIEEL